MMLADSHALPLRIAAILFRLDAVARLRTRDGRSRKSLPWRFRAPPCRPLKEAVRFRLLRQKSGIDQAVADAARGEVEREGHSIGSRGVRDGKPISAHADANGIGLDLKSPADVVGGPGKG